MKIVKNATGVIEIRNSGTNALEKFFDPTGMIVNDHPRLGDCICVSKTPNEQDEQESINIKLSEVSHVGGVAFSGTTRAELKEALVLLFRKGGGDGEGSQGGSSQGWQRPNQWLAIPAVGASEEVFYGLHAVWNTSLNPCTIFCNGTGAGYTVDWGDGTITDYAFGVKAERNYVYSALSAATEFRGYRQALVKVTPRAGAVITNFDLFQRYTGMAYTYSTGWLEKYVNFGGLTAMNNAWTQTLNMTNVENFTVKKHPNIGFGMFYKYNSLVQFTQILSHVGSTDNMNYLSPVTLRYVNMTVVSSVNQSNNSITFLPYIYSLKNLTITGGAAVKFQGAYSLKEYPEPANMNIGGDCNGMFRDNYCLREIPAYNLANVTNLANWIINIDKQIVKINAYGAKVTHTIANQLLDKEAIIHYATNIGTANAGATITITGNPGAAAFMADAAAVALFTSKGWTIIN